MHLSIARTRYCYQFIEKPNKKEYFYKCKKVKEYVINP